MSAATPQHGASSSPSSRGDEEPLVRLTDPMRDMAPVVRDDGSWSRWLRDFDFTTHPQARLGMIRFGLKRTRWYDKAFAFDWYLRVANGYNGISRSSESLSHADECRWAAFDAICEAVSFAPNEPRPFHIIRMHYVDNRHTIDTLMAFVHSGFNLPRGPLHQGCPLAEFISGFARLHWHEIRSPTSTGYPKDRGAFVSWLVANRPRLLRWLYRHRMFESLRLPDAELTPDDVVVLRSCVFEDVTLASPDGRLPKTLQAVRERGDRHVWEVVRLITRAEARHRDSGPLKARRQKGGPVRHG